MSTRSGLIMVLVAVLLALQSICFSAATTWAGERVIVARQHTPRVELYITSWCPYCRMAVNFFQSRGIPFVAYDVEKDYAAAQRKANLGCKRGVPFAVINGRKIKGYSEESYLRALNSK